MLLEEAEELILHSRLKYLIFPYLRDSTDSQKWGYKERADAHINLNKEITEALLDGHAEPK